MKKKILFIFVLTILSFYLFYFLNSIFPVLAGNGGNTPQWFDNSTNNTIVNQPTLFSVNWTDAVGLSGYVFSTNNTGTWTNDSFISFKDTFGKTDVGGTDASLYQHNVRGSNFTLSEDGIVTEISVYLTNAGSGNYNYTVLIYNSSLNYIARSDQTLSLPLSGWYNFTFSETLEAGKYNLAFWTSAGSGTTKMYYDAGTTGQSGLDYQDYNGPLDPITWPYGVQNYNLSIYATYYPKLAWSNVTKTLNDTTGALVQWRLYANDTSNNWNATDIFNLTTTGADTTKPHFSNNATNTTVAGQHCNFTIDVIDNNNLDSSAGYIFSTNNSGSWANSSYNVFSGSETTLKAWNVTTLNSTVGALIQWKFYANDTSNNWNTSQTYSLTTTSDIIITIESSKMSSNRQIISRPNTDITVYGKAFYTTGTAYSNQQLTFTYDTRSLGTNDTDSSGNYWFTFSIPYEGGYDLTVRAIDSSGNTGENSSSLFISTHPLKVKFNFAFHLGTSKANNNFTIYKNSVVDSWENVTNTTKRYLCSHDGNNLLSLIHSYKDSYFYSSTLNQSYSSTDYLFTLTNDVENSQLLLTFSKGTCQVIEDRMYLVESYSIPSNAFSSFSYPIPRYVPVLIQFKNDRIQINGTDRISKGDYKICVENFAKTLGNKPMIKVGRC